MRNIFVVSLLLVANSCPAGEVSSPETFMRENYGWTIKDLDTELGMFGNFRAFKCYDDILPPPKSEEENDKKRWASPCVTFRGKGENLAARIVVTWANPKHKKPITTEFYQQNVANNMANEKENNSEPKCEQQVVADTGKNIGLYDCAMILPFGTYFASYIRFEHRGIDFFVRAANASNSPDANGPKEKIREILKALSFF